MGLCTELALTDSGDVTAEVEGSFDLFVVCVLEAWEYDVSSGSFDGSFGDDLVAMLGFLVLFGFGFDCSDVATISLDSVAGSTQTVL